MGRLPNRNKEFFIDWITKITKDIIDSQINGKKYSSVDKQYWKQIATFLDETVMICNNDRYFSLQWLLDYKSDPNKNFVLTCYNFTEIQKEIDRYFKNIAKTNIRKNKIFNNPEHFSVDIFVETLMNKKEYFEEFINLILKNKDNSKLKFDNIELTDVNGFNAKSIYEKSKGTMTLVELYYCLTSISLELSHEDAEKNIEHYLKNAHFKPITK